MRTIRVRIEDWIYKKLKERWLKYKTWQEVVNEALAMWIEKHSDEPRDKIKATIVEHYYEAKSIKRIFMMLHSLEKDFVRLSSRVEWDSDPTLASLLGELADVVKRMKERISQLEEEELEGMKDKVINSGDTGGESKGDD